MGRGIIIYDNLYVAPPYYRRRNLVKIRERILLDTNLHFRETIALLRLLDYCVYVKNKKRLGNAIEDSVLYNRTKEEITYYENKMKSLEVMNEAFDNNSSTGELRDSETPIATFCEYESAR